MIRRYTTANVAEAQVADLCHLAGCQITRRGWPDFFGFDRHGRPFVVEVKQRGQQLKVSQWTVLSVLAKHGLRCFVAWVAPDGTVKRVRFDPVAHLPRANRRGRGMIQLVQSRMTRSVPDPARVLRAHSHRPRRA
jgi:hypothetical protein